MTSVVRRIGMSKSKQLRFTATKIERTLQYYYSKTFKKVLLNHNLARREC